MYAIRMAGSETVLARKYEQTFMGPLQPDCHPAGAEGGLFLPEPVQVAVGSGGDDLGGVGEKGRGFVGWREELAIHSDTEGSTQSNCTCLRGTRRRLAPRLAFIKELK
jgi:hypothetical protein